MKCRGFLRAALLTVVLAGVALGVAGWPWAARPEEPDPAGEGRDPFASRAAQRWRHGQPAHWRALMLKR